MNDRRAREIRISAIEVRADNDGTDNRSLPDAVADARRMLELITSQPRCLGIRALLLIAQGVTYREIAREIGVTTDTVLTHVRSTRERLAAWRDRGEWEEPKQPKPPSPRTRKRKR